MGMFDNIRNTDGYGRGLTMGDVGSLGTMDFSSLASYGLPEGLIGNALTQTPGMSKMGMGEQLGNWINNSGFLGKTMADGTKLGGWGAPLIAGASGLMNGYLGFQQLGVAKDSLAQSKKEFDLNWGAQKQTTNSQLEDRQRARVASNPGAYQSVSDYMNQNGIK